MIRKACLALLLAALLVGCAPAAVPATTVHHSSLTALLAETGFSFDLPTQLPSDFLQTDLACLNGRTASVQYSDGSRQLTCLASSKASDQDVTASVE